jgi:dTDP-4-amino-4,6-dideoxygalactose transaminase
MAGTEHERIEFNRAYTTGAEFAYMQEAIRNAHLASSGPFSQLCNGWLRKHTGALETFLTHSCTAALEMAFTLAEIGDGDEVVMPSFTFVTTANAVVARGGRPVFVDVRPDTRGIDE